MNFKKKVAIGRLWIEFDCVSFDYFLIFSLSDLGRP